MDAQETKQSGEQASSAIQSSSQGERSCEPSASSANFLKTKSRIRITDLREAKLRKERWAMLTSYDSVSAKIFDCAKIPCILVGDSAAQTVYGQKSTIPITVDELLPLARAVSSSCQRALVIGDLPFGSYQESPEQALRTAVRFMKESQVHGVKLEGGKHFAAHVALLSKSGVPVMAHIGFTPQSEHALGGYKVQGRTLRALDGLLGDALELQEAGAFACVLELVPPEVGKIITERLNIPTIGIGAGPHCDAQILVWHDMAGFTAPRGLGAGYLSDLAKGAGDSNSSVGENQLELNRVPKFVKRYANMSEILFQAATTYANEVEAGVYPAEEHCYD